MRQILAVTAVLGAAVFTTQLTPASAEAITPDAVKIVEGAVSQPLTPAAGDPAAGKKWFKNRKLGNCLACHVNPDMKSEQFHGETGPTLEGVAERYKPEELRAILVNSKTVFGPDTLMPSFYRTSGYNRLAGKFKDKTILSAQQVEDIVAYLMTLK